jgi:hypothetical protein
VTGGDTGAEREVMPPLLPSGRERAELLTHRQSEPGGVQFVVSERHRIVAEHHQAVAGEVLKCPVRLAYKLACDRVEATDHLDQLLRLGGLRERRESTQIEVDDRDIRSAPRQKAFPVFAGHQRRANSSAFTMATALCAAKVAVRLISP